MSILDKKIKEEKNRKDALLTWICFFLSTTTLFCCTIPVLLVMLGLSTTLIFISTELPFLMYAGEYKFFIFLASGGVLLVTYWALMATRNRYCPVSPELAGKCKPIKKWSAYLYWTSVVIWGIGFLSAYLLDIVKYIWL